MLRYVPDLDALLGRIDLNALRDDGEAALYSVRCPDDANILKSYAHHLVSHVLNLELEGMALIAYEVRLSENDTSIWQAGEKLGF